MDLEAPNIFRSYVGKIGSIGNALSHLAWRYKDLLAANSQVEYASRTLHEAKSGYECRVHDNPSEYCRIFANRDGWGTGALAVVRDAYPRMELMFCYGGLSAVLCAG